MPSSVDTNQTQFNVNVVKSEAVFEEMKKQGLPPRQIFMTPDVAGNVNNLRVETIYDMNDATKNFGKSNGLWPALGAISVDLSKYDKLLVDVRFDNKRFSFFSEVETYSVYSGGGVFPRTDGVQSYCCGVSATLSSFSVVLIGYSSGAAFTNRDGSGGYLVSKVQGILKNPAAIYTGFTIEELTDRLYPVNSTYMSLENISPASKFGGTWEPQTPVNVPSGTVSLSGSLYNIVGNTTSGTFYIAGSGPASTMSYVCLYRSAGAPRDVGGSIPLSNGSVNLNNATLTTIYVWKRIS